MKYFIDKNAAQPAYLQLYRQLRRDITDGAFSYGDKLYSKRLLAEETGVSVITVEHSYQLLEEEGYIEARPRSGYYVCYRLSDFANGDSAEDDSIKDGSIKGGSIKDGSIKNGSVKAVSQKRNAAKGKEEPSGGDVSAFPFSLYAKTMRRVLAEQGEKILMRSPRAGCVELREAIAAYLLRSRGMRVTADQILIGAGAEYLYSLIPQMLGREGPYGLEDPSYAVIRKVYEAAGVPCTMLPMGPEGIESEALKNASVRLLHVTPFTSYPTGITATASKRAEYLHYAKTHGAMILEDDYNSEFSLSRKAEDTLFLLEPEETVLYMNTFSRTIAPSVRIGYLVLPAKKAAALQKRIDFYNCTVPVFEQLVLSSFIDSGDFERHINRVRRLLRKQKNIV